MSEPFLGEIKLFPYNGIPTGWHICDGSALPVNQNAALYSLIGTIYGGNTTAFNLPDLRGRTAVGAFGTPSQAPYGLGTAAGSSAVALGINNIPAHTHGFGATTADGNTTGVNNIIYAKVTQPSAQNLYAPMSASPVAIDPSTVQSTGAGAAHNNMQPFEALIYCIAIQGYYPPRP